MSTVLQFDDSRAKTYIRGALAVTLRSSEPILYFRGDWAGNKGKEVSPELAAFLQKGLNLPEGSSSGDLLDAAQDEMVLNGLCGLGFGAQVMTGEHFVMASGPGDAYGCDLNENGSEPLAYQRAIKPEEIDAAVRLFEGFGYNTIQLQGIRFALESLGIKVAPIRAYQLSEADCDGDVIIQTILKGKVESESKPTPGTWLVQQANGEIMPIYADKWDGFGYIEYEG